MAFIKSIDIREPRSKTNSENSSLAAVADYITNEEKTIEQILLHVDGTPYKNLTAELILNAKKEIAVADDVLADYITDDKKTQDKKYVSSQNCADITIADDFEATRMLRRRKKYNYKEGGKGDVLAYHVIQSFNPGTVTSEQAHLIGQETAFRHFGEDAQILIATHTDKEHIHNHILVNGWDLQGNRVELGNLTRLRKLREVSDEICLEHGLEIIKPKQNSKSRHYKAYMEKNPDKATGGQNPWDDNLRLDIDRAIVASENFDEFVEQLHKNNWQ